MSTREHVDEAKKVAEQATYFANSDGKIVDRNEFVASLALQSIAYSLAAIAEVLVGRDLP